jgi:pyruvate/2-oxoglutarate/acetoin dehydrogenase E1 component/TPP-dependent pyruvate/acetoin dehydrogenase alpha subunit
MQEEKNEAQIEFDVFKKEILNDYKIACESREASLLGRKEVLTGKAKFGIFGDGKEIPQIAMAKVFKNGDWRSGYYRDQTFMLAAGMVTLQELFAQLYATPDTNAEPNSGGRQMNAHFSTRVLHDDGSWKNLTSLKITSADSSPTAGQMTRSLGLALASKLYRENNELSDYSNFTNNGDEVTFVTIGDASTSEGHFWETINAAGVLKVPLAVNVWDDGYGISVPKKYQTTKGNISDVLSGFEINENGDGYLIYKIKAWDYADLCEKYTEGIKLCREKHIPVLFHIEECTQPQGHSTSGSHERYKTKERLEWEKDYDCILQMKKWMIENAIANETECEAIEQQAKTSVLEAKQKAWAEYQTPIKAEVNEAIETLQALINEGVSVESCIKIIAELKSIREPFRKDIVSSLRKIQHETYGLTNGSVHQLNGLITRYTAENKYRYNTYLHSHSAQAVSKIDEIKADIDDQSPTLNGFEILNNYFDQLFANNKNVVAFGEDLGNIGDVNQGFAGLQAKYGESRIFDVGIREATIMGQGIGLAMRGWRPIAEIQYLDYLLYGLQPLSDDLATLHYRSAGGQKAPLIVRTRGHRLEGIWHTGSPMQMILGTLRGMNVCVPRNMTQAAGMYNTLLQSDEPGLVIECLNGYRLKEKLPNNLAQFTIPFGMPEILQEGTDVTIVSYGSSLRIAQDAMDRLAKFGVSVELIDVQTLLPFDVTGSIVNSLKKTNRILFFDEDVPGGATAYMMQQVIEMQKGFYYLDTPPKCLSAVANRAAYGTDGDYFCKPSAEDVFDAVMELMRL